jgi:hypothetical protein
MITSFKAKGFRPFKQLSLTDLRTLNIIVGRSASGKTALLEGIRLALGATPQVAFSLNSNRGFILFIQPNTSREQFESAWSSLFFAFDIKSTIALSVTNSEGEVGSLEIRFDPSRLTVPITPAPSGAPMIPTTVAPIAFHRRLFSGEEDTLYGTLDQQGGLQLGQGPELGRSELYTGIQPNLIAGWFSQMSIAGDDKEIIAEVTRHFSDIVDLSVQAPVPFPTMYATMKTQKRKVPLSLVSSGIYKFVALLVLIRVFSDGVVLIDEIENGIYYETFPALWEILHRFAKQNRTQLFLSTHSLECIKGALPSMEKFAQDFTLLQVGREDGSSTGFVSAGRDAAAAIESGIELRR